MKKQLRKLFIGTVVLVFCLMVSGLSVQAATVKTLCNNSTRNGKYSVDLTGNGKKDDLKLIISDNSNYFKKVTVKLNGKTVYTSPSSMHFYMLDAQYIKMSKKKVFLYLLGIGDSEMPYIHKVFRYDSPTGKLAEVLDLDKYALGAGVSITKATSKTITVNNKCASSLVGRITWNYTYTYKNGTFTQNSPTAAVSTVFKNSTFGDGYDKYYKKNKYKAQKNLTLYTDTAMQKAAFSVTSGKVLKLQKITIKNGTMYFRFKYKGKTGWMREDTGAFAGISQRLAGGFYG